MKLIMHFVENILAAFEVAGSSEAHADLIFSGFLCLKEMIESNNTVDARERNTGELRNFKSCILRNVALFLLHVLQNHNQIARFVLPFFDERNETVRQYLRTR